MAGVTYDDFGMVYQALLFSTDEKASRVVSQILRELEFQVEACAEPFIAVKQLTNQHYDALVVDCDNEQNAILLFKTARNSSSNSGSLAVGLAQGQGGIAKAFRIGANLVLTKPIHAEQSKGTLRTAKGLLRKAEAAKPNTAPASAAKFNASSAVPAPEPPVLSAFSASSIASGALELQEEQFPELEPAEAALLESMPDPTHLPSSSGSGSQGNIWQPAQAKSSLEPMGVQSLAGSAASAAAPAKISTPLSDPTADDKSTAHESVIDESEMPAPKKADRESRSSQQEPFAQSVAAGNDELPSGPFAGAEVKESKQTNSKKNFLIAAVLVLGSAGALYYAWPQLEPLVANLPLVQKYLAPQPPARPSAAQPVAQPAGAPSQSTANTATESQTAAPVTSQTPSLETLKASTSTTAASPSPGTPGPADDTANSSPKALHLAPDVAAGLLIEKAEPVYPASALQQRIEGSVELQATIGKDGSASGLKVLSGKSPFASAAAAAVRQWKYKPYEVNGQPAEFQTEITVDFKLPQP